MKIENKVLKKGNTIINKFSEFIEILIYKQSFDYSVGSDIHCDDETGEIIKNKVERARKFIKDENGVLHPLSDNTRIEDIQKTILKSCERAKDNFYGYALCNKWRYFITLTFSPEKVNKDDEAELKYCWQKFRQNLQCIDRNVKILCCPERHKSGKLHFHTLVGDIDLTSYITPAINPKTNKPIKSKYGQQVYNIDLWKYGFTTLVELDQNYNELQVANYLISYVTKDGSIGYNNKKYYRTHNLNFKDKEIFHLDFIDQYELVGDKKPYKENDKMIVYRVYNEPEKQITLDLDKELG